MSLAKQKPSGGRDECTLFALTQYECAPVSNRVRCFPLERIFRKCGRGPVVEITNILPPADDKSGNRSMRLDDPVFSQTVPEGKQWKDIH
ncbi:hypothetical protein BCR39DRAFT_561747 [Naematelia encephala]|uniref:Uncharacterized protein n=1 Tax=Naematelia encephala TaxID=71784 RepID=A0A1Y2AP84_9TREE|nr:hypothetical protein BCR39DRAFT_561747 [Naematelia encephala]